MSRAADFNYIEEKLSTLSYRIKMRGKINLLDLNIYSEPFFADMLNLIFGWNLKNYNLERQNSEGIDLLDKDNKIVIQVSSTVSKQKIEDSLKKSIIKMYSDYTFKFVAISDEAGSLRGRVFDNPYHIAFDSKTDIIDIKSLLSHVLNMEIEELRRFRQFIQAELGQEPDMLKVDTNLAVIIDILSKENLTEEIESPEIIPFEIERKNQFNDLGSERDKINDYIIYFHKLNEKYEEFDRQGVNKSFSVLQIIRKQYLELVKTEDSSEKVFDGVIDRVIQIIRNSRNYKALSFEELELCVFILVVDAFVRCKIFRNPEGYVYVAT